MILVVSFIVYLLRAYRIILFARIILSWIRLDPYHPVWGPIQQFVYQATEPVMAPIRSMIPPMGMFDISIIFVFLLISAGESLLIGLVV